jgi:hypothetical protein
LLAAHLKELSVHRPVQISGAGDIYREEWLQVRRRGGRNGVLGTTLSKQRLRRSPRSILLAIVTTFLYGFGPNWGPQDAILKY